MFHIERGAPREMWLKMDISGKVYFLAIIFVLFQLLLLTDHASAETSRGNRNQRPPQPIATTTAATIRIHEEPNRDSADPLHAKSMHPVTRLYMIQAKNHQLGPIYKQIAQRNIRNEKSHIIRQEFQVQVKVGDKEAIGWGDTKRSAKREATVEVLKLMGLQVNV